MPEISIIVPVYKVEAYLDRCVNSILNQTFTDFELILVDDGSPDRCPMMCDEWAKRDDRIQVIHKKNGGLSSARNAGLDIAKGNYIGFVDSDDWIETDMYEYLYKAIIGNDADYASIEMQLTWLENVNLSQPQYKETVYRQDELFRIFFRVDSDEIHYYAWDKLYRKETIKDIRFWEGMRFEDIDFNFKVIEKSKKGVYVNQIKYNYFYNTEGITRNKLVQEDLQLIAIWENVAEQCKTKYPGYYLYADMNKKRAYMGLLGKKVKYGVSEKYTNWERDQKEIVKHLRGCFMELIQWKMPFSRKLLLCGLCINTNLISNIYQIKRCANNRTPFGGV